jgi:hypothetical protein
VSVEGAATEPVHMVWDYYDGPRQGIADFLGRPHHFINGWDAEREEYGDAYALAPIDPGTMALAREQWQLWLAWKGEFDAGLVDIETHPGRSSGGTRYGELQAALDARLAQSQPRIFARGRFSRVHAGKNGSDPLTVRWTQVPATEFRDDR